MNPTFGSSDARGMNHCTSQSTGHQDAGLSLKPGLPIPFLARDNAAGVTAKCRDHGPAEEASTAMYVQSRLADHQSGLSHMSWPHSTYDR